MSNLEAVIQPIGSSSPPPQVFNTKKNAKLPSPSIKPSENAQTRAKKNAAPAVPQHAPQRLPRASFTLLSTSNSQSTTSEERLSFAPRLGKFVLTRAKAPAWNHRSGTDLNVPSQEKNDILTVETPGMMCGAVKGVIRHLSRDMVAVAKGVEWIHISFEDFLEHNAPIPTLHPAPLPLHTFLNHPPSRHILSISLRDLGNNQQMPANTNAFVQAKTVRGVRKVTISDWISWCKAVRPDIIWAFADAPKTLLVTDGEAVELVPGEGRQTSQKRITRSLERSVGWLEQLMSSFKDDNVQNLPLDQQNEGDPHRSNRPPIIAPLMGGCDRRARAEFSHNLTEKLDLNDQKKTGLKRLDDGIIGYAIELVDLPTNQYNSPPPQTTTLDADQGYESSDQEESPDQEESSEQESRGQKQSNKLTNLLRASLKPLSYHKPRIAHTAISPHTVLRLILDCGIDLFDTLWLQQASDYGIALSFEFPAPVNKGKATVSIGEDGKEIPAKRQIGENLFEDRYAEDFEPLGSLETSWPCAPVPGPEPLRHSSLDDQQWPQGTNNTDQADSEDSSPFTRAYIHHLLRTHEMSSHVLLRLHNLAVTDKFFQNIRALLHSPDGAARLRAETIRFYETYDIPTRLYDEAKNQWREVDSSRGKGRLKREREAAAATVAAANEAAVGGGVVTEAVVAEALEDVS